MKAAREYRPEGFLRFDEVADLLGCTEQSARQRAFRGALEAEYVRGEPMVREDALLKYLDRIVWKVRR